MAKPIHHANRQAKHLNPSHAGMRTGNPQFDPEAGRRRKPDPGTDERKPHAPEVDPQHERDGEHR